MIRSLELALSSTALRAAAICVGLLGLVAGCCPPDSILVTSAPVAGDCRITFDYEGTALNIAVTYPGTESPGGPEDWACAEPGQCATTGLIYWGLDTTEFPDAITPTVDYGTSENPRGVDTDFGQNKSNGDNPGADPYWNALANAGVDVDKTKSYPLRAGCETPVCNSPLDCTCDNPQELSLQQIGVFQVQVASLSGTVYNVIPSVTSLNPDTGAPRAALAPDERFQCGETYGQLPIHYGVNE